MYSTYKFHVQFSLLLPDLHIGCSGGRSGGLVFHLFKNFLQFALIHTVKGFGIVNKAEADVFLELACFLDDPTNVGNLINGSSAVGGRREALRPWQRS